MQRKWLLTISTLFFLTPAISSHSLSYNNPLHSTTPPHAISSEHNIFYVNHGGNGGNGANGGNGGNGLNNGNGGDGGHAQPGSNGNGGNGGSGGINGGNGGRGGNGDGYGNGGNGGNGTGNGHGGNGGMGVMVATVVTAVMVQEVAMAATVEMQAQKEEKGVKEVLVDQMVAETA